jgi:peptide-methionine (S)-S-oxide reductase
MMNWTTARPAIAALSICLLMTSCNTSTEANQVGQSQSKKNPNEQNAEVKKMDTGKPETELAIATFGGGCFWCVEGVFEEMKGVQDVVSGYEGGSVKNPTYKQVCTGKTGHAEVCQIKYDPKEVTFPELLEVFFKTHDPTTLNRQGNDFGPQYRSVVFYHDEEQKQLAEKYIKKLDESGAFDNKIVTEVTKSSVFYEAEEEHQDFYARNPGYGYCVAVVRPKVEKFRKVFSDKVAKP